MKLFDKHDAKKASAGDQTDFYEYAVMPEELRTKIFFMMERSLQSTSSSLRDPFYLEGASQSKGWNRIIYETMNRKGSLLLAAGGGTCGEIIHNCLLKCDVQDVLILIEEFLTEARREGEGGIPPHLYKHRVASSSLCDKMNSLFSEYRIGYEFLSDATKTIRTRRIDSTYTHEKMIKPTLALLHDLSFKGPSQEFNDALDEYNNQNYSNAINNANKAFESMMKAVLQELEISFNHKDPAKKLIDVLFDQQVTPSNLQSLTGGIRTVLTSGLPAIRNAPAIGHGSGRDPQEIERSYAEFAINLCATYILFLEARYKEKK